MRRPMMVSASLLSLSAMLIGASAASAGSVTRIETRPVYGATVTTEEGVRVFRPLPPERHVIINPDGKTPLNLTFEERNVVVHKYVYNYGDGDGGDASTNTSGGYAVGYSSGRRHHRSAQRPRHGGGHMIHVPSAAPGGRGGGAAPGGTR